MSRSPEIIGLRPSFQPWTRPRVGETIHRRRLLAHQFGSHTGSQQLKSQPEALLQRNQGHVSFSGGLWPGRIAEFFGPESSGKTSLGYSLSRAFSGKEVIALIDAEHALNLAYAESLGVSDLLVCHPTSVSRPSAPSRRCSRVACFIVVDSVAALTPGSSWVFRWESLSLELRRR